MATKHTIKAGCGGNETQDWALMLLTMYMRWAARNGYRFLIHKQEFPDWASLAWAGIKSATFEIDCPPALLESEIGVHRLVRSSPFDPEGRRHTSFAELANGQGGYVGQETKGDISFGAQIRSYVLTPYQLVKDTRSKLEITDVRTVLDGYIEPFIEAYSMMNRGT